MDMLDAGGVTGDERIQPRSFSDIAILYRTHRQADIFSWNIVCKKKTSPIP